MKVFKEHRPAANEEKIERYHRSLYASEKRKKIVYAAIAVVVFILVLFFSNLAATIPKLEQKFSPTTGELISRLPSTVETVERDRLVAAARVCLEEKKATDALATLFRLLEKDPGLPEAHHLTGTAYLMRGDLPSARAHFSRAVELKEDHFDAHTRLGEISLLIGDYPEARRKADLLKGHPGFVQAGLLLESEIELAQSNLDAALRYAEAAFPSATVPQALKSAIYLAELYMRKGDAPRALEIARQAGQTSTDADSLIRMAKFYFHADEVPTAQSYLDRAITGYPENPEVQYVYGQYLSRNRKYKEAARHYREALRIDSQVAVIRYDLAQALLLAGELEEAHALIEEMLFKEPDNLLFLRLMAQYHILSGNRSAALATLKRITELAPESPRPHLLMAALYWQEGLLSMAQQRALRTLELDDAAVTAHLILGDVYSKRGQFDTALEHLNQYLSYQPDNLAALMQAGDLHMRMGQPKTAEALFRKALAAHPKIDAVKMKMAEVLHAGGNLEAALDITQRSLKTNPDDRQALRTHIHLLVNGNRLEDAVSYLKTRLIDRPEDPQLLYTHGDLLLLKGDADAAFAKYQAALEKTPRDVNLVLNIGARYEQRGLLEEAERLYTDFLSKNPGQLLVINQLVWLCVDALNAPQRAREWVLSLESVENEPGIRDTVGWYYYRTGDLKRAERHLRAALAVEPGSEFIQGHLAHTLLAQKDPAAHAEVREIIDRLQPGTIKTELMERARQTKDAS